MPVAIAAQRAFEMRTARCEVWREGREWRKSLRGGLSVVSCSTSCGVLCVAELAGVWGGARDTTLESRVRSCYGVVLRSRATGCGPRLAGVWGGCAGHDSGESCYGVVLRSRATGGARSGDRSHRHFSPAATAGSARCDRAIMTTLPETACSLLRTQRDDFPPN